MFYKVFPQYLVMGMSYDQFWCDDCLLVKYYREADELRRRRENFGYYLQGAYVYDALLRIAPVLHAFAKKGTKATPYLKEPYVLSEKEHLENVERKEKQDMVEMKAAFEAFALRFNERIKGAAK